MLSGRMRQITADVTREVAANLLMSIPAVRNRRLLKPRTTRQEVSTQAHDLRREFEFFMKNLGRVTGKTIAEIGPGDTIGLAPLFLAAGAKQYIAIDRFLGDVYSPYALELYDILGGLDRSRVTLLRAPIESLIDCRADAVVSFNVIEHLRDPLKSLGHMRRILKPGGTMVHRIDYGPHGCWQTYSDPLTFLKLPAWLWNLMGSARGYPNRVPHEAIVSHLRSLGLSVEERPVRLGNFVIDAEIVCHAAT